MRHKNNDWRSVLVSILVSGWLLATLPGCFLDPSASETNSRLPGGLTKLDADRYMSSVLADFDGDGYPDLMLGAIDRDGIPSDLLLLNDGMANFQVPDTDRLPVRQPAADYGTVQLRAADIDADGDNDVIAAIHAPLPSNNTNIMIYLNDGAANFTDASANFEYEIPGNTNELTIQNITLADVDGDDDPDVLIKHWDTENAIYLNDGSGRFSLGTYPSLLSDANARFRETFDFRAADADRDGDMDIVALPNVYLNDDFQFTTTEPYYDDARIAAGLDVPYSNTMFTAVLDAADGGNPILVGVQFVFLDEDGAPVLAFRMDDEGRLHERTLELFDELSNTIHPRNLYVADFDGNGTEDLFVADHGFDEYPYPGAQNHLFLQTKQSKLIDASDRLPQVMDFTHDAAIGDIDRDGDIDIYAANLQIPELNPHPPYIMLNDGAGNFTLAR